jgi:hypothetical protein
VELYLHSPYVFIAWCLTDYTKGQPYITISQILNEKCICTINELSLLHSNKPSLAAHPKSHSMSTGGSIPRVKWLRGESANSPLSRLKCTELDLYSIIYLYGVVGDIHEKCLISYTSAI